MKKEQLLELGLTEEQADKVLNLHKEVLSGFIPKARFDEVNETKKELEQQIQERDDQLKELQKKAKGNEELKRIKLQEANNATKEQYDQNQRHDLTAQSIQLTDANTLILLAKFDRSKLSIAEDSTVLGVDEQLTALKEQYKDLFKPDLKGREPNNTGGTPPGVKNPWSKEHFNLTEQGRILRENPELAKQLMTAAK